MGKVFLLIILCLFSSKVNAVQKLSFENINPSNLNVQNLNAKEKAFDKITVTASKSSLSGDNIEIAKEKINKISGGVAIVENQELQSKFSYNVKDMLDYVAGVLAQPKAGQESRLSIRGSGLSRTYHLRGINLYQDGIPINLADGSADFQDVDPLAFDHIEVFKGANGLHLGSASLGGAINFISPTGYNSDAFSARVEGGSFGSARANISTAKVIDKFDYFTSLSHFHSDGYRNQNSQSDSKLFSNFGYRISNNLENRTYFTAVNSNLELPGALTRSNMNNDSKQANKANISAKQERNFNLFRLANKTSWRSENTSLNAGIFTNIKELDHPIFQVVHQQTSHYGAFGDANFKNNLFGFKNEFLLGLNLSAATTDSKRFANVNGSAGNLTVNGDEKASNAIFYVQDNLALNEKFTLTTGSQFIFSKRDYRDYFLSDGNQSGKRNYHGISPKIGGIYQQNKNLQFFGNVSAAYEPPTFTEVRQTNSSGLANISAQKSYSFELGTRRVNSFINWDLAVYRSYLRDELILFTVAPSVTQAINAKRTIHQGLELGFDSQFLSKILSQNLQNSGHKIKFRTAYTLNDFRFVDDKTYGNNRIPGAPLHYIRSEIKYENSRGFFISPNVEISPQGFFIDSANTVKSRNYWLLGLNAGIEINKNILFFLDARNLLNRVYSPTTDVLSTAPNSNPAVYYPGNSRSFFTGLKFKW